MKLQNVVMASSSISCKGAPARPRFVGKFSADRRPSAIGPKIIASGNPDLAQPALHEEPQYQDSTEQPELFLGGVQAA